MSSNSPVPHTIVITDTSCLIILDKISLLDILHQLFDSIITTPEIAEEYRQQLPNWITVISAKNKDLQKELGLLIDNGEASAIALAKEIENQYLITDDLEARKIASKLGLAVIGTLGVLLRAKQAGHIDSIKPVLEKIKQTNFRLSTDLYQTVLDKAGES